MSPDSDAHDPDRGPGGNLKIIDLEFETLRQFREVMAPRLNYDGFFVATKAPLAKGTPARFRFLLQDGFVLAEGTGVVAWTRGEDEEPELRAGMALLFNQLEQNSREIIDELIDFNIATGGDPFDLGPVVSEAGDIGTDALAGDRVDVEGPPPEPELETVPDAIDSDAQKSEDILPDWLSEVAQKLDSDRSTDETIPVGEVPEEVQPPELPDAPEPPEPSVPVQEDFEISLMPEEEAVEPTPIFPEGGEAPEVTMTPSETRKPSRERRLWPFLAAAVVIAAAAVAVWWFVIRAPQGALQEPVATVEEIQEAEPPLEITEEKTEEAATEPPPVFEIAAEEPGIEELAGPATRVLLVAATHVGDETVVTVRVNGELAADKVRVSRLKDPARVWVRIQGIETFYRPNDIEVGTAEVDRIRVGHHPEESPQSIYVVLDLENPAAVVRDHTVEGDTLRIVVGRP